MGGRRVSVANCDLLRHGGGGRRWGKGGGGKLICSVRIWIGSCRYMHTCKVHGDVGLAEVVWRRKCLGMA